MAVEPRLDAWLGLLEETGGTALLLTDGSPPLLRIGGRLTPLAVAEPLTGEEIEVIARAQVRDRYGDRLHAGREVDFSFSWRGRARIRATAFYQQGACSLSLHAVPLQVPDAGQLRLPGSLLDLLDQPGGLIVVAGAPGSGTAATMAALVQQANRLRPRHIVTVEDPIEYVHHGGLGVISQREIGSDTESFQRALRSARRAEADVVMLAGLREPADLAASLATAEGGCLVLTSINAEDAVGAVERIVESFPLVRRNRVATQVADTLLAVLHQRQVPRVGGGSVPAYELLLGSPEVRAMIRANQLADLRAVIPASRDAGMRSLQASLVDLLQQGLIDSDGVEAGRAAATGRWALAAQA